MFHKNDTCDKREQLQTDSLERLTKAESAASVHMGSKTIDGIDGIIDRHQYPEMLVQVPKEHNSAVS